MKETNKDPDLDDKLTDFTDRVLAGKSSRPDSSADEELRRLEETIIRLKRAIPRTEADKTTLNQIESLLTTRLRREPKSMSTFFWRKGFDWNRKYAHSRKSLTSFAILSIVFVALISTFFIQSGSSSMAATSFASRRLALTAIALMGVAATLIWIHRRR